MPPVILAPIATGLKGPIGIDYHEPTDKVVVSVNYPSGQPHNFELVEKSGTHTPFSTASGFTDEIKIASVRSGPHQGGFTVGELYTGTGAAGVIARISPDGLTVQNPWVMLPGENGTLRGGLFQDRYGVFGGDLIAVTTAGNVWRVTSGGVATKIASLGVFLEGVTTVPNDPDKYGPWAGKIVAGGNLFYAIDASGGAERFELGVPPEDIDIIPAGEHFFGVDYLSGTVWGAPPAQFAGMVGDFAVAQESGGVLWHVRWDSASNAFQVQQIAEVAHWEHVTFAPPRAPVFQYAVKFVCGKSAGKVVAPGTYFTAINVHNPTNKDIRLRKKFVVALPGEEAGPVSNFFEAKLGPDRAFEIDCPDIFKHLAPAGAPAPDFLKGFVVIESDVELDVVVVYTAGGPDGRVTTLDVERVPPRRLRPAQVGLPDLIPVPDPRPGVGFCRLDEQGRLLVRVKNQGTADAPASTTTVHFAPGGSFDLPTPAIPAGGTVDLPPLPIPGPCYNPDCNFRIVVDSKNEIVESDEGNNFASGLCLG